MKSLCLHVFTSLPLHVYPTYTETWLFTSSWGFPLYQFYNSLIMVQLWEVIIIYVTWLYCTELVRERAIHPAGDHQAVKTKLLCRDRPLLITNCVWLGGVGESHSYLTLSTFVYPTLLSFPCHLNYLHILYFLFFFCVHFRKICLTNRGVCMSLLNNS